MWTKLHVQFISAVDNPGLGRGVLTLEPVNCCHGNWVIPWEVMSQLIVVVMMATM